MLTVLVVIVGCALFADARLVPRIFNGDNARIESYPYQVSLDYDGRHVCGGSIIAKHYVLTAAHCSRFAPETDKLFIRAGSSFPGRGGSLHKVTKFVNHRGFKIGKDYVPVHDIAIIKVEEPFHYDDTCRHIELLKAHEEATLGAKAVVTGWGLVNSTKAAVQLQAAELAIISKQVCKEALGVIEESQICALGENGKNACTGDSGGPIAIDGRLAGVVSWGEASCRYSKYPSVYTEVADYHDWINEYVQFD